MSTKAEATIEEVTQKLENGDRELLELLRRMVKRANRVMDPDLEQDVFLKVLEAFRRRADIRHPRALMRKIVHDTVVDAWRTRARAHASATEPIREIAAAAPSHMEEQLDHDRRLRLLREAILELGCDIRGPVYLFYVEGYSIELIGRVFGKSRSAVKMALYRGRRKLSERLSGAE